ncbi:hypothetical protein [Mucilaginibacter sp. NFR10]|jgi:hypothetical protein|uniref:hypothetical protein n=1 Tax=Mucilaginibacter sp. NFR10 TaxID=1566292 RepID=UPI0008717738|nr:hypothetical protein [Mucilaginibacter sp. NFR10]SCW79775.1 hypothetical protein SAMN03159284_04270 [Mucilaginibacter sp. NFR10]
MTLGYRPNHVFEYNKDGNRFETYIGDIRWDDGFTIEPGEEKAVTVRFLLGWKIERYLNIGRKWWIHEGPRCVGEAELFEFL